MNDMNAFQRQLTRDLISTRHYLTTEAPNPMEENLAAKLTRSRIDKVYGKFTDYAIAIGYDTLEEFSLVDPAEYHRTLRKITRTSTRHLGDTLKDRALTKLTNTNRNE